MILFSEPTKYPSDDNTPNLSSIHRVYTSRVLKSFRLTGVTTFLRPNEHWTRCHYRHILRVLACFAQAWIVVEYSIGVSPDLGK